MRTRFTSAVLCVAVLLLVLSVSPAFTQQQQFANLGFESWPGGTAQPPGGWSGGGVSASSNARSGAYAAMFGTGGTLQQGSTAVVPSSVNVVVWMRGSGHMAIRVGNGVTCTYLLSASWDQYLCRGTDAQFVRLAYQGTATAWVDDMEVVAQLAPTATPRKGRTPTPTASFDPLPLD